MSKILALLRQYFWVIFLLLLAIDFVQSNYHYSNLPMDGDTPRVAAPMIWYQNVLDDPIGIAAITTQEKYSGAGRYVCHAVTQWWFTDVYDLVKKVVGDPVHSIYYTSTLLVALLHLCFICLAYFYTKQNEKFNFKKFIPIALLASVLIQLNSFYDCIGFLDRAIDYVLFYALPITVLLFYLMPFYKNQFAADKKIPLWQYVGLVILAPVLAFSGPLIQPIVFIIALLYFAGIFIKNPFFKIKRNNALLGQLLFFVICCLYAFYVSQFNSESSEYKPLTERYILLAKGLARILTLRIAWALIITFLGFNFYYIMKHKIVKQVKLKAIFWFAIMFCAIYILLLPLGGYRVYREYIIRYDTFIPVTLTFFFLLFYTSYNILNHLRDNKKLYYQLGLFMFCIIFLIADKKTEREANYCQQGQLYEIMASEETVIRKEYKCNVLVWDVRSIYDVENMKAINIMLRRWGILQSAQRVEFYESEPSEK